ncbi:hypothetical protein PG999_003909 [Apiospora kogelbergensis]|uniref:Uncharacterized protein n=1 Tax=Apiospora kogelbergensis TaxID=1337665 RepID=A0AAW0R516_9PEZI
MATISPLAARTLHNIIANHAVALEKKAPEVNPASVPLPCQTEDELDDLTFTYVDFNETEGCWGMDSSSNSDDTADDSESTPRTSTEEDEDLSDRESDLSSWGWTDNFAAVTRNESIADLWFGSDTMEQPSSIAATALSGTEWEWESQVKMEACRKYRVERWTPRQLELFRYHNVFSGRDDERDHDRLLAARYMKKRALDFMNRRKSQAKSRFNEHSDKIAKASEMQEPPTAEPPSRTSKSRWASMTVDEL